jgi:AcrR family transcriptional regulator
MLSLQHLVLARAGAGAFWVAAAARRAGVTPAASYAHFQDRDALLAAAAEEGFAELLRAMDAAAQAVDPDGDRPGPRIDAYAGVCLQFALAQAVWSQVHGAALLELDGGFPGSGSSPRGEGGGAPFGVTLLLRGSQVP